MSRLQIAVVAAIVFLISSIAVAGHGHHQSRSCDRCAVSGAYGYAGSQGYADAHGYAGAHGTTDASGASFAPAFGNFGQLPAAYGYPYGSPAFYPYTGEGTSAGDPYTNHFGPGFHRSSIAGHYRFPYYTYRAPWYYPGTPVYHRDTNFAW